MSGWLTLNNGTSVTLYVDPRDVYYGCRTNPDLDQLPGDDRIWIDLDERTRLIEVKNAYATSNSDHETLMTILEDDKLITLTMKRSSGSDRKFGDAGTSVTVGVLNFAGIHQIDKAGARWHIERMTFAEAS